MNHIPILSEEVSAGRDIDVLFWTGCAGSYDARAQKVSRAFAEILSNMPYLAMRKNVPEIQRVEQAMNFCFKCWRFRISKH